MRGLIERARGRAVIAPSMKEIPLDDRTLRSSPSWTGSSPARSTCSSSLTGVGGSGPPGSGGSPPQPCSGHGGDQQDDRPRPRPEAGAGHSRRRESGSTAGPRAQHVAGDPGRSSTRQDTRLSGRRVVIQEYWHSEPRTGSGVRCRARAAETVAVYRWGLPDDLAPLKAAIESTIRGEFRGAALHASAQQAVHVLRASPKSSACGTQWLEAANRCVIEEHRPTATETLVHHGLTPDVEPEHGKMGHLVRAFFEQGPRSPQVARRLMPDWVRGHPLYVVRVWAGAPSDDSRRDVPSGGQGAQKLKTGPLHPPPGHPPPDPVGQRRRTAH